LTWVSRLEVIDLRNIRCARMQLGRGLNVLVGPNAQGKTSLLEALGVLARTRSFRSDEVRSVVRHGADALVVRGTAVDERLETQLEVELAAGRRRLRVGGAEVGPREYHGRLEAQVYSTERLRVVRGTPRERRQYFDRGAAALWPAYRQWLRDFERALAQRNAALESGRAGLGAWSETFLDLGARVRARRARYLALLQAAVAAGFRPGGERYEIDLEPHGLVGDEAAARELLQAEMEARRRDELRARRSLAGPHRDAVVLRLDGGDAARMASSGQARSLMLALTLAALEVYRSERGTPAVALLDDLDSELDEARTAELCRQVAARGQAVVTTAHPGWVRRLDGPGTVFEIESGRVRPAA
jgi:DNA replication and repair protein RecF